MIADRVLDGLGNGIRQYAGPLLDPLVEALVEPVAETDELLAARPGGWVGAFDLSTPHPAWLAQLVGVKTDSILSAAEQREIIQTRPGWAVGTVRALVASLRTVLVAQQRVLIAERDTSPWHATISVYETDFAPTTTRAVIEAIAERHRPAGFTFDLVVYPPSSYHLAESTAGTYVDAEGSSYQAAEASALTYAEALSPLTYGEALALGLTPYLEVEE